MADDNSSRYRSNDPYGRGPAPAAPANDPLAELARLIGRNDPFSDYADARPLAQQPDAGAPRYASNPAPPPAAPAPRYSDPAPQYSPDSTSRYGAEYPPRYTDDRAAHNNWPDSPSSSPAYPSNDPFALPSDQQPGAPHYDSRGYASPSYPDPNYPGQSYPNQAYADPLGRPGESYQPQQSGYDPAGYPATPDRQGYASPLYPHESESGSMPAPHDDEFYDDVPRGGRRKGLLTVVAVLGLAVVGTAGAFGYRSLFGGPGSSSPPPVIRASGEPSKVAPPPVNPDQSASKFSYDRFGDAGKDEQVVRREEKPVDVSRTTSQPRTVLPGAPVASPPSTKPANAGTTAAANPPSAIGEPRRVRTVPIRPDQGDAAAALPSASPQAMSGAPPRQANTAPPSQPADVAPATAASTRASSRVALRSPPAAAAPAANAPLSLSPDANANASPAPSAQDSFPPPRAASPPARVASAPAPGGGSYLVQVSSQKSEADAQSAYRSIQSKYAGVLGSHPHTVRRADLGAKGVYYRAMVGPFGSREEAVQLCSSLKQAGGDCVVQH